MLLVSRTGSVLALSGGILLEEAMACASDMLDFLFLFLRPKGQIAISSSDALSSSSPPLVRRRLRRQHRRDDSLSGLRGYRANHVALIEWNVSDDGISCA